MDDRVPTCGCYVEDCFPMYGNTVIWQAVLRSVVIRWKTVLSTLRIRSETVFSSVEATWEAVVHLWK